MPIEIEVYTLPHFKGPFNAKVEPEWAECASNFSVQTSLLKIGCLLHKSGFVDSQLLPTVILATSKIGSGTPSGQPC